MFVGSWSVVIYRPLIHYWSWRRFVFFRTFAISFVNSTSINEYAHSRWCLLSAVCLRLCAWERERWGGGGGGGGGVRGKSLRARTAQSWCLIPLHVWESVCVCVCVCVWCAFEIFMFSMLLVFHKSTLCHQLLVYKRNFQRYMLAEFDLMSFTLYLTRSFLCVAWIQNKYKNKLTQR